MAAHRAPSRSSRVASQSKIGVHWRSASGEASTGDSPTPGMSTSSTASPRERISAPSRPCISSFQVSMPAHTIATGGRASPVAGRVR